MSVSWKIMHSIIIIIIIYTLLRYLIIFGRHMYQVMIGVSRARMVALSCYLYALSPLTKAWIGLSIFDQYCQRQTGTYFWDLSYGTWQKYEVIKVYFLAALWSSAGGGLLLVMLICVFVTSIWCPGSGVVLDWIDSWSLPSSYVVTVYFLLLGLEICHLLWWILLSRQYIWVAA